MAWIKQHILEMVLGVVLIVAALLPLLLPKTSHEEIAALSAWANYGQSFGWVAAVFSCMAFAVAVRTQRLQQQQIKEANETSVGIMRELSEQTRALQSAAETNALAAIIHQCERDFDGGQTDESKERLRAVSRKARTRLIEKLEIG